MQSINSAETYVYGTSKDLVSEKEANETKMINFDDVVKENIKENNLIGHKYLIIHTEY